MSASCHRPCDYCGHTIALLYCRADSAKLCFSCDREVHSTNQLFSKHTRFLLCDICDDSPATIFCSTESSVLCQNCDWEKHNNNKNSMSSTHERRPLEGFNGCPCVNELLGIVGFEDIEKKSLLSSDLESGVGGGGDGYFGYEIEGASDLFVWDAPSVVSLDDLISTSGSSHNYQAMEVPPLPKNRKAACGMHKEEVLSQLSKLAKSEPLDLDTEQYVPSGNLSNGFEGGLEPNMFPSFEFFKGSFVISDLEGKRGKGKASEPSYMSISWFLSFPFFSPPKFNSQTDPNLSKWHRESSEHVNQVVPFPPDMSLSAYTEEVPVKHSTSAIWETHTYGDNEGTPSHSLTNETLPTTPKAVPCELTSQERDSALLRYKQKKKTRRYEKHIRYESRKVRAESRIRVKGRFAKMKD